MSLSTIGSIAIHLGEIFPGLPDGVSGNLVIISDMARQHVETYTGKVIDRCFIIEGNELSFIKVVCIGERY